MRACTEVKRLCDEIIEAVQHGECIDTFKWSLIERIAHEQQNEVMRDDK